MGRASYSRDDVGFYGDFGRVFAAVNIKVPYKTLDQSVRALRAEDEIPETLTEEWIRDNVSEDALDAIFWHTCQAEYEYFTDYAAEILPGTTFHQDGRSGGWAVSNHTVDDVESWDAVKLAKWGKIERVAREIAAGVNEQVVLSVYINEYAPENLYVDAAPVEEVLVTA